MSLSFLSHEFIGLHVNCVVHRVECIKSSPYLVNVCLDCKFRGYVGLYLLADVNAVTLQIASCL